MMDFTILARPRISLGTFTRILTAAHSPAAPVAAECWAGIVAHGVDPALALAVFQHETSYGTRGIGPSTRNWGALRRSPHYPSPSGFVRYPSWPAGARDAARLLAIYGADQIRPGRKTSTAQTFPFVWAPASDGNAPDRYGDAIVAAITRYIALERATAAPTPTPRPRPPTTSTHRTIRDDVRLRSGPNLSAEIIRTLGPGAGVRVEGSRVGSAYLLPDGWRGRSWLRVTAVAGRRLRVPLWSAALLYAPIG